MYTEKPLWAHSRAGYYKQRDLIDYGFQREELGGGIRAVRVEGACRAGAGEEQRVYWAQVGFSKGCWGENPNNQRLGSNFPFGQTVNPWEQWVEWWVR